MATVEWISNSSNDFSSTSNWSTGSAPTNNDTIVYSGRGQADCTSNLPSALTGVTVYVYKAYTGKIGVAPSGSTAASYFTLDGGTLYLSAANNNSTAAGSSLLMFANSGATAMTFNIYDSYNFNGSTPPIQIKGGTNITINQFGGVIGIGIYPGETATITHNVGKGNVQGTPSVFPQWTYGAGVTLTALTANTGSGVSQSNQTATAVTLSGNAAYRAIGTGAHTTLTVGAGTTAKYFCSGTIGTLGLQGVFDRTGDTRALTITTANLYKGCQYLLDNGKASSTTRTTTNLVNCGMQDIRVTTPISEKL